MFTIKYSIVRLIKNGNSRYLYFIISMEKKTHTVDKLRMLYTEHPETIKQRVKSGDKIYTDNDWLESLLSILKKCSFAYSVASQDIPGKGFHEVTITAPPEN
jgi:hypothetical protein